MRLNFDERKKLYQKQLDSGEIFESNGDLFLSATATKEGIEKLKNAEFPENSVTVLGEKIITDPFFIVFWRLSKIRMSFDDVDFGRDRGQEIGNSFAKQ